MSSRTREINKITMAIIRISVKLMLLALLILLLYEAVIRGYAFGHAVFYAEAVEAAPGHDITVVVKDGEDVSQAADELEKKGLIKNIYAFLFQSRFYDYDKIYPGTYTLNTSMTSKEILQKLSEKPEDAEDDKSADKPESAKAAQKTADQNTGGSENAKQKRQKDLQDEKTGDKSGSTKTTQKSADQSTEKSESDQQKRQSDLQTEEANAADPAKSTLSSGEAQADAHSYSGEDEEEGGWIEDVTEDGQNDRR